MSARTSPSGSRFEGPGSGETGPDETGPGETGPGEVDPGEGTSAAHEHPAPGSRQSEPGRIPFSGRGRLLPRAGIAGTLLLFLALFVTGATALVAQAFWTTASLNRAAAHEEAATRSAIAARTAAGLEAFALLAGGVLQAGDSRLRGAPGGSGPEALEPLMASAGFRFVALVGQDGMLRNCLAAAGQTCPTALPGLLERPGIAEHAFTPGREFTLLAIRDRAAVAELLLVRPAPQAGGDPVATIAELDLAPVAAVAAAGGRTQSHLVTILDAAGQLLHHADPAATARPAPGPHAGLGQPLTDGGFLDPIDNRVYPASLAEVPGLGWTVVVHRRDAGMQAAGSEIWVRTAILAGALLLASLLLAAAMSRSHTRAIRRLGDAIGAVRTMAHQFGPEPAPTEGPAPTGEPGPAGEPAPAGPDRSQAAEAAATAAAAAAAAARHPSREIRQLATATTMAAAAVRARLEDDAGRARSAEQSNDKKSAFVANISHQLRTPLNSIIGFSEMMTDQVYGPLGHEKYSEYAHSVHDSGTYLLRILNDVRDLSRAEIGTLDLEETTLDVGRLLRSSISILYREASARDVILDLAPTDDVPVIRGDEQRLQQALINLITHSIGFSPDGGRVEIATTMNGSGEVCVRIQGSGSPIAEQDLAKLLTPFDEVQRSYDRRFEGAGLGLPLARTLLEMHGGRLDIDSLPGRGNALTAVLPASRVLRHTAS